MYRRHFGVVLFCLLIFAGTPVFAASLEELIGSERADRLRRGETLTEIQQKNITPRLIPGDGSLQNRVDGMLRSLSPGFFVETLYLYRKPPEAAARAWNDAERTALYNEVLALSSLAGLQYYSASRKEMRTFYETSSVVNGPEGRQNIADPVFASPPAELTLYARQKDLSFGNNIYRYDYYVRQDSFVFVQENLTTMHYGIIPAVGRNKLRSVAAAIDAGDCLLLYAVSMAKAASLPGMSERVGRSFSTRAEAILNWFSGQADKAFGKARL
ncbi:MAG: hypothetical protein LBO80_10420 [Treponema sp.]|jgi:hypothetical protein|nr:hypothetical protein [Treponema sp.]